MGTPTISYSNWCDLLSKARAKHGGTIAYGPETYDAWARGASPEAFAKSKAPKRKWTKKVDPRAGFSTVTIEWYAIPNGNKNAGGWLPVYDLDGKQRGHTYWSIGYDKATAEADAKAAAEKEAERYTGDWNIIVKKGKP